MSDRDYDDADEAYGFSIGEEVTHQGFVRAKIVAFDADHIVFVKLWDPDLGPEGDWGHKAISVSANDLT
jgi:hydrogenase maturation factor